MQLAIGPGSYWAYSHLAALLSLFYRYIQPERALSKHSTLPTQRIIASAEYARCYQQANLQMSSMVDVP
jgi:hypothetical protein